MDIAPYFTYDSVTAPYFHLIALGSIAFGLYFICKRVLIAIIKRVTSGFENFWVRSIFDDKVLSRWAWIPPVIFMAAGVRGLTGFKESTVEVLQRAFLVFLVIVCLRAALALLTSVQRHYSTLAVAKNRPIKGFIQVLILLLWLGGAIMVFSAIFDKSPWVFLSGLGAATAVLLLVFRDTILSFVAGIQLTSNQLIQVGDWIEMKEFDADGDVIDIALNSVKVQNFDRTITVIPTHKFLEHSFKNWRGMQESGGRRIKRSINIDVASVQFLGEPQIKHLKNFRLLKDYLERKESELREHNRSFKDPEQLINARRLTNLGTFRAYVEAYLKQHPKILQDATIMVRQLDGGPQGVPIEVYVFTTTDWAEYEATQANIFDHLYAILSEFDLRAFQDPTGLDFAWTNALSSNFKKVDRVGVENFLT